MPFSHSESHKNEQSSIGKSRKQTNGKKNAGLGPLLSDVSPEDKPWDINRSHAQDVQSIYNEESDFKKLARRIGDCSEILKFDILRNSSGERQFKLAHAQFCRVRHCPVCQWRRSLKWKARFYEALPEVNKVNPKAKWLFLTLTVRNCAIEDLRTTIQAMNKGWKRLSERKVFRNAVLGFVRTTEVTRGKDNTAHPHFHIMLMVKPSYFKNNYISLNKWIELWKESARLNYSPNVDIRRIKDDGNLEKAIKETLKYSVKPVDMVAGNPGWFLELTRQVDRLRFIATGGVLKDVLKEDDDPGPEPEPEEDEGAEEEEVRQIGFEWRMKERHYRNTRRADLQRYVEWGKASPPSGRTDAMKVQGGTTAGKACCTEPIR